MSESEEVIRRRHPAELLSEELAMGENHPSYYPRERRKKPREDKMKTIIALMVLMAIAGSSFASKEGQDVAVFGPGVNDFKVCSESQGQVYCR